jgi:calmodulin
MNEGGGESKTKNHVTHTRRTHAPFPPVPPSNGVIDRDELRAVLESTSSGLACTLTHWLTDADVDAVLAAYGGGAGAASLTRDQFAALAADGVLLAGTLDEYAAAFAAADAGGSGTVSATELADLLRSLGRPMSYDALVDAMARYDVDASGRLDFYEFLRMFRKEGLLALDELVDYVSLTPAPAPPGGGRAGGAPPHAKPVLREVSEIFSEAELDAALAARGPDGVTVLMASLTWCRPCRALARPLATLAAHYPDALFLKLYGNTDDETKRLFRDVLKVRERERGRRRRRERGGGGWKT